VACLGGLVFGGLAGGLAVVSRFDTLRFGVLLSTVGWFTCVFGCLGVWGFGGLYVWLLDGLVVCV